MKRSERTRRRVGFDLFPDETPAAARLRRVGRSSGKFLRRELDNRDPACPASRHDTKRRQGP